MPDDTTEANLVNRAVAGDQQSLSVLLFRNQDMLIRQIALQIPIELRTVLSPEDIVQEVMADAFRDIKDFESKGDGAFAAWLQSIARHRMLDAIKHEKRIKRDARRVLRGAISDDSEAWVSLFAMIAGDAPTPSRSMIRREALAAMRVAIARLPPDYREALELRYLRGLSVSETAQQMRKTDRSVHMLCNRALGALAAEMGSTWKSFLENA